jgi:RecB family exonuclease
MQANSTTNFLPFTLTPSRLREYLACPAQFKLKNLDRLGKMCQTPQLAFGNSIHAALQEYHSGQTQDDLNAADLLRRHWFVDGYASVEQASGYFDQGVGILEHYIREAEKAPPQVVGCEVFLTRAVIIRGQPDIQVRLSCKIDRLDLRHDSLLEALDYKTSADGNTPSRDSLARDISIFLYYLAARLAYPQYADIAISLLNLFSLQRVEAIYTDEERASNKAQFTNIIFDLAARRFDPQHGAHCAWCPVTDHCPGLTSAASLDEI